MSRSKAYSSPTLLFEISLFLALALAISSVCLAALLRFAFEAENDVVIASLQSSPLVSDFSASFAFI